ncbi:MAG: glycosyltransferase 87 family protein, partial [Solirubrobacterales bacterium]
TPAAGSTPGSKAASTANGTTTTSDESDHRLSQARAISIARTDPQVAAEQRRWGHLDATPTAKPGTWQVDFYADGAERVQVIVDDATGNITETWTGYQIAWQMARGYPDQFGHKLNAPYVWIPLAAIFFFALLDFRRKWRMVHLDLLVLLSFGISEIYFNAGQIGISAPLAYPPLIYLLARMIWIGFRGPGEGLRPSTPTAWLAIGGAFLIGFRVALNIADSGVIDVGYAGVIGAQHLTHGQAIWGNFPTDNPFGDTYGPFNYLAYVPFELVLPWSGQWDDLPAAHAAAIFFDLATVAGLFVLGRRLRPGGDGTRLGVILAFAWAAYPFTDYALQSNSNDTLLAALLVWALVLFAAPVWRGVLLALAVAAKFAPLPLAPLFAAGLGTRPDGAEPGSRRFRPVALFAVAFAAGIGVMLIIPALDPGLGDFYDRTVKSQLDRTSPFSIWGQDHSLEWLQTAFKAFAVGLALLVAFLPRRRSLVQVAALAAAVMIAVELTAEHWFYLYIPWFAGLALPAIAFSATATLPVAARVHPALRPERASEPARSTPRGRLRRPAPPPR